MSDAFRIALLCVAALLPLVVAAFTLALNDGATKTNLWVRFLLTLVWLATLAVFAGFGADSQSHFHMEGHHSEPLAAYWAIGGLLTLISAGMMWAVDVVD